MPIGGDKVWGQTVTSMPLVRLNQRNLTMEEAYDLLGTEGNIPEDLQRISSWLLDGVRRARPLHTDNTSFGREPPEHLWSNPLVAPLPFAPNMRKYAFYGVGVPTELSGELQEDVDSQGRLQFQIHKEATKDGGFFLGDGDYSCPILSLGAMCLKGWQDRQRNPAWIPCTVKEFRDVPSTLLKTGSIRGGASSGDHIDLLGNDELLADVLTVASGGQVDGRITSNLEAVVHQWDDT